ncbi:hypothetical protein [Pseudomonas sp. BMS12]|uniref:hypothetical protein n=1 Tax=Pseudomonas sp. BMS12 TaxID=1796033 RepID=UPI000B1C1514|nr:hypothetical protein [Pseudomonas sp. BMS12]
MITAEFVELLSKVPNVVWSGLSAALLTLTGVVISNASNTKRLKIQLKHDASEKAKERTGKLRQEVYLLVAEELGKANHFLGSLGSVDITKENAMLEMRGLFSAVTKLQLVAEPSTAFEISELSAKYGAATLRLLAASDPIRRNRIDIEIANKSYEESLKQVSRYQETLTEMVDSGVVNPQVFDQLQERHDYHFEQMSTHSEKLNLLWDDNVRKHVAFTKALIAEMKPLCSDYVEALKAIREDLGQPTVSQNFEQQMLNHWDQMEQELVNVLKTLQSNEHTPPSSSLP